MSSVPALFLWPMGIIFIINGVKSSSSKTPGNVYDKKSLTDIVKKSTEAVLKELKSKPKLRRDPKFDDMIKVLDANVEYLLDHGVSTRHLPVPKGFKTYYVTAALQWVKNGARLELERGMEELKQNAANQRASGVDAVRKTLSRSTSSASEDSSINDEQLLLRSSKGRSSLEVELLDRKKKKAGLPTRLMSLLKPKATNRDEMSEAMKNAMSGMSPDLEDLGPIRLKYVRFVLDADFAAWILYDHSATEAAVKSVAESAILNMEIDGDAIEENNFKISLKLNFVKVNSFEKNDKIRDGIRKAQEDELRRINQKLEADLLRRRYRYYKENYGRDSASSSKSAVRSTKKGIDVPETSKSVNKIPKPPKSPRGAKDVSESLASDMPKSPKGVNPDPKSPERENDEPTSFSKAKDVVKSSKEEKNIMPSSTGKNGDTLLDVTK